MSCLQVRVSYVWNTICCNITDDDSVHHTVWKYVWLLLFYLVHYWIYQTGILSIMYKSLHECHVWLKLSSTIPNKSWFYQCQYLWGVLGSCTDDGKHCGSHYWAYLHIEKNWVPCSECTLFTNHRSTLHDTTFLLSYYFIENSVHLNASNVGEGLCLNIALKTVCILTTSNLGEGRGYITRAWQV